MATLRRGLGQRLRALRAKTGRGIKRVAPELGITYTYLSKLENSAQLPSEKLLSRIADYYGEDRSELFLAAGRLPEDVAALLQTDPERAVAYLRRRFAKGRP